MLDIAQSGSCQDQDSRIYKLQEKELKFSEAWSIEEWNSTDQISQKKNFYRFLEQAQARENILGFSPTLLFIKEKS